MTTYYVSSQVGNDNNVGTSATAAFATLQAAANHTAPGDTVLVMNGTYKSGDPVLNITTGGTASAPITFMAAPGQTPVIDSSGNWNAIDIRAPYIVISGFTVVGNAASITLQQALANASPGTPFYDGNGIAIHAGHVIVENNTVHDEPGGGIYTEGADYIQILNNVVYNNAHWSVYGNSGISVAASVNADSAAGPHIIISGNLVYGNAELVPEYRAGAITDGEGIILDSNSGYRGGFLVQNNTVYNNGGPGIEAFLSDNAVITLNILYGNNTQNVQAPSNSQIFINQSNNVTITSNSTGDPNDHTPPAPPVISGDTVDFNAVTLTGTAEANSTIKVFDNSTQLGTATTNANGQWSFTTGVLANGSQSFTATATDLSLNESTPSSPLVVVLNGPINLVNNGNFETNNFNGWTLSGTLTSPWGPTIFIDTTAEFGQFAAGMGPVGSDGAISQSIATTPGQQYTLSFWLRNEGGGPNDFTATWNGQALLALTNSAAFGYTEYTYTVTATGGTTALQFSARQDPSRWDLDSISLTPVGSQPPPAAGTVSINDVTISEGNSGTKVATFTVTRSGGTAAFDVNFATSDATATVADSDYVAASNTLHFGAAENTKTISVTINGDTKVEANETFNVLLSNATNGATISDNQGVGTITNDDSAVIAGTVSINDVTISEGNSGTKVATFTVTRSGGTAAFAVNIATSDGTATVADGDYVATSGTLNFGANENTKTIAVTINGDTKVEANETFNVVLSNATNGATISDNQGVGTITNDDSAAPAAPVIASFATDSGVIGDGVTNDNTLTLTGTAPANNTVNVLYDGKQIGTTTANASGAWSYMTGTLVDGKHSFTATDTNSSGSASTPSSALVVTVDTTAPAQPVVSPLFSPDTAPTGDGHTTATILTLTGTGEANSTITAFDGTKLLGTAPVNASGVWNFTTGILAVGAHSFTAKDTDVAGNVSVASAPLAVTVDSTGSNIINGTRGNDILTSAIGNDIITTRGGNDLIIFSGANFGNDTITDFRTGNTKNHDIIQFDHTVFADFAAVQAHAGQVGLNTVITLDANDSVTLTGVLLSNLHSFDFNFV